MFGCSRQFWNGQTFPGVTARSHTASGGPRMLLSGLDITGCSWVNLKVSGHLVAVSSEF